MRKIVIVCLMLVMCISMVGCTSEAKMKASNFEKQDKISFESKDKAFKGDGKTEKTKFEGAIKTTKNIEKGSLTIHKISKNK